MCPSKPAWRIGMKLLISVEGDDVINWGKNESDSERGCWDTEGRKSVFPIESWYGSDNITHCRAHVITCSALALSTVLRTTSLSYGNMPFSGTHPTKTPWPIVLKFCTVDYVGETTKHAKNGYNRLARGGSPYRWNISIYLYLFTLPYLTFFFFVNKPTDQTTEPICTHDISNDADCSKEVPFGGLIDEKNFSRGISLPQNFQRAFYMQIEKVE
jgi:hypothetical protein